MRHATSQHVAILWFQERLYNLESFASSEEQLSQYSELLDINLLLQDDRWKGSKGILTRQDSGDSDGKAMIVYDKW